MKSPGELGRPGPGRAAVEFVCGPHDGERAMYAVDPETMMAPKVIGRGSKGGTVTYLRRENPSRCLTDGMAAWHYDAQPTEAPA